MQSSTSFRYSSNWRGHTFHPVLDQGTFESIRRLMKDRFPSIVTKYLQTSHFYMEQIEKGIARANPRLIAENAHPLKSASATLGLLQVAELAARLESRSQSIPPDATDLAGLQPLVNEMYVCLRQAHDEIRRAMSPASEDQVP